MGKRKAIGTVKIMRATAGMTKFLTLPVETEAKRGSQMHGISYPNVRAKYLDTVEVADSDLKVVDA